MQKTKKTAKAGQGKRQPGNDLFLEAYARLNAEQKKAVDAIEGPVMVIAGPGTGKTQMLTLRVANILRQTDTPPDAILALTFTESGVAAMRTRLRSLIGARAYEVRIHTFHGFANAIITRYPERFPRVIGGEQLAELDALGLIERVLDEGEWQYLRPVNKPYHYVRPLKKVISDAKRENIAPDALAARIAEAEDLVRSADDLYHEKGRYKGRMKGAYAKELEKLDKAREAARAYEAYERSLAERHRYDFDDTLLELVRALERDPDLKLILQEEHQYLLADEHQDANGAQNRILELLSDFHESPNLFIVGDEKQAIFRFQGASLENFLFFKRRYPDALLVELTSNYRSTQVILDAAHDVIAPARGEESVPRPRLAAGAGHPHRAVAVREAPDADAERADLIAGVRRLLESGTPPGEIAVLLRRNADVASVAAALRRAGVTAVSLGDADVLSARAVREFMGLLAAAAHFGRDEALYPLLYASFAALPNLDIFRLTEGRRGRPLYETLASEETLRELGVSDIPAVRALHALVDGIATAAKDRGLADVAYLALERSGLLARLAGSERLTTELESLRAFLSFIEEYERGDPSRTLRDLVAELARAEEYGLSLVKAPPAREDAVRVMTAHKAKGLEFDAVFIPECIDARWGGAGNRASLVLPLYAGDALGEDDDDERRLFYVAMTRARKHLTLSYARAGADGRESAPSRFLADIGDAHVERVAVGAPEALPLANAAPAASAADLRAYVIARLAAQGLSVSALNNYLESPWKYFFKNLLRMPEHKKPHQYFGTAVDAALRFHVREGADADAVVAEFARVLGRSLLSEADLRSYRAKGEAMLRGYLAEEAPPRERAEAGVSVSVPFATGIDALPELTLRGEYDLLEHLADGRIRIVDWKTGDPKTRNDIEGKTKNSNGNYKRQLVFYALLESLREGGGREVAETAIQFIEPDAKGRYRREAFVIAPEETAALTDTLKSALRGIVELSFLDTDLEPDAWEEGRALVERLRARLRGQ